MTTTEAAPRVIDVHALIDAEPMVAIPAVVAALALGTLGLMRRRELIAATGSPSGERHVPRFPPVSPRVLKGDHPA